jgi:hypothetical protein
MLDEFADENYDLDLPVLNDRWKDILNNPNLYPSSTVDEVLVGSKFILETAKKEKDMGTTVLVIPSPWDPAAGNTHVKKAVYLAKKIDNTQYIICSPLNLRIRYGVLNAHQVIEVDGGNGPAREITPAEYKTIYDALPEQTRRDIWAKTKPGLTFPGDL